MRRSACALALALVAACHDASPPATATQAAIERAPDGGDGSARRDGDTTRHGGSIDAGDDGGALLHEGYVGSARCQKCHKKQYAAWQKSWHARALARAGRGSVEGDFGGAHFAGTSSEAWTRRRGDRFVMRTRGPGGAVADFDVDWVIGGKRMQDAVTLFADGRWQVLPVYWQVARRAWVDYTESKQGPLSPDHPFYWTNFRRMANRECLDCHTTGLKVRWDEGAGRWQTSFADAGVACEDCHGPGARHVESTDGTDVFRPKQAPAALALSACAQCHGPRNPLFPLFDADHRFRPGQRYDDFYDPVVVLIAGRHSGDFFADGRPKSSSFEYQALLQSACWRQGGATCLSCHAAPHDAAAPDELRAAGDESCRGCHAAVFAAGRAHTQHRAAAAQSCRACHMPKVVTGVLATFADHALDVPVPANTKRHGVPNACGTCHADWSADKLDAALTQRWPDAGKRQARRRRLADAFDEATAADSLAPLLGVIADGAEAPTLRGAAAVVLAERFPGRADAIVPLLDAADTTLRAKACEALAVARARFAADRLAARTGDAALPVRQAAALALASLGDARAEAALERLAHDAASTHLMQPHFALGRLYAHRGDLAAARRELTEVARLSPYFADAILLLAEVAARQSDLAAARTWVDDVLRIDPTHAAARALAAQLPPP